MLVKFKTFLLRPRNFDGVEEMEKKIRQRHTSVNVLDVQKTLNRIDEYFRAGLHEYVYDAVGKTVHPDTLRSYLANPEQAQRAYKIEHLIKSMEQLPSVRHLEKEQAYRFALREMRLEPESQVSLKPYNGVYNVIHNFQNPTKAALNEIEIIVSGPPQKATFFLIYRSPSTDQPKGCDGLVMMRGGRIVLAGLSKHGTFFANVGISSNPITTPLMGGALFDDVDEQDVCFSKIALVRKSVRLNETALARIQSAVANSHTEI